MAQEVLVVVNDGPYGNERAYNALRLALTLCRRPDAGVRVFLMGDGVGVAKQGQHTPEGCYNLERMIRTLAERGMVVT